MQPIARSVFAVVGGILAAGIVVMLIQMVSFVLYPLPEGLDPTNNEAFIAHVRTLPAGAFLIVLASWFIGPMVGAIVAGVMARGSALRHAIPIGLVFLVAAIFNLLAIPHPMWFWAPGLLAGPLGAWMGAGLVTRRQASRAVAAPSA